MDLSSRFKHLGRDTLSYGLSAALQKFIAFLLFPVYTRLLTKSDYGSQDLIMTGVMVISMFLILGMDSGTVLHYYKEDDAGKALIRSTWFWFELVSALPVCLLLGVLARPICTIAFKDASLAPLLRWGLLSIPFSQVGRAILLIQRLTFQTKKYIVLTTAGILTQVLAAIGFVVIGKMGVKGVLLSVVASSIVQAGLGILMSRRSLQLAFSLRWAKSLLKVGLPLVPAALSLWILNYSNRYFLVRYNTLGDIGLLSVTIRISSILLFIISAFEVAWGPFAYSLSQDLEAAREMYAKVLTFFLLFSLSGTVILSIFARETTRLLATPVYESGSPLVFLYCFSSISWMALYIVGMGAGIAKKTYHNSIAIFCAAVLNTILNIILIPSLGITGAAIATLAGNIAAAVYMYIAGQHYFRVNYEHAKVGALIGLATASVALGILIDRSAAHWSPRLLGPKALLASAFVGSLFALRILKRSQLQRAYGLIRAKFPLGRIHPSND
jgi:O-antigen/teichoic acid export membrane protein